MSAVEPLVARSRGLAGRLLGPSALRALASVRDRGELTNALVRMGYLAFAPNAPAPDEWAVEAAIRRVAARRLGILERWSRECDDVLAPLLEDEDRRSLRALVRGALGGVPPAARIAGLIPTSGLPARALDELALLNDLGAVGAALIAIGHPYARVVAEAARRERPDLFALDQAVTRLWATRARASRREASVELFVERSIDIENLWAARLLAEQHADVDVESVFVAGGRIVTADDLRRASSSHSLDALALQLAPRAARTPLARLLDPMMRDPEDVALGGLITEFRVISLREPLGAATAISYVLRLRREQRTLFRLLWQLALGVPVEARAAALGAAA